MLRTLLKFRLILIVVALVLITGGAMVVGASEGTASNQQHTASSGVSSHHEDASETPGTEPSKTPGTEPSETDQDEMSGTITSLDCAKGSITIKAGEDEEEGEGGTFTALLTNTTVFTVNGKSSTCADLKVGTSVEIEATHNGTTWTALKVSQGENDQDQDNDDQPGDQGTPTPGSGGD